MPLGNEVSAERIIIGLREAQVLLALCENPSLCSGPAQDQHFATLW